MFIQIVDKLCLHFKILFQDLKRDMTLEDEFGKPLLAVDVFGMSIMFLVDDMLKSASKGIDGIIKPWEIHLVVTVPAIWSDAAKQFMREATKRAGICEDRLTIALEPEAASLYCRHLHIHKHGDLRNESMNKLPMGTKYIVVDAGGGTIDVELCTSLASSQYAGLIELKRDKMKISNKVFVQLFDKSVTKTVGHLKSVLSDGSLQDVRVLLMVGGYSESPVLRHAILEALPEIEIVIPVEASSVVLRGALIYGHNPLSITERILKYTYGTSHTPIFIEGVHPEHKRFEANDNSIRCRDVFDKLITTGRTVKTGETQVANTYCTISSDMKGMLFNIYASEREDPVCTDDDGCFEIGRLEIELDEVKNTSKRDVSLYMLFGGTEIIVEVEDKCTGKKKAISVDFLR
ncbi:heat shock 70 kDa protein 12B-like [Ruditapes philippinarum]|uniref:heat shock 70 kDa protein 12B-like n=1 Tax=Ruditapes philippinarum TaxID=129788 RepID=UPI00295BB924|nr:heat shock 70 kDa protein 12B-like [Ruditapes philippinarum]